MKNSFNLVITEFLTLVTFHFTLPLLKAYLPELTTWNEIVMANNISTKAFLEQRRPTKPFSFKIFVSIRVLANFRAGDHLHAIVSQQQQNENSRGLEF